MQVSHWQLSTQATNQERKTGWAMRKTEGLVWFWDLLQGEEPAVQTIGRVYHGLMPVSEPVSYCCDKH